MTTAVFIGIDVSKSTLDVGTTATFLFQTSNDAAGYQSLLRKLMKISKRDGVGGICVESTGCYSRAVVESLYAAGLPVFLVQPNRVRQFARSAGVLAKTDRIDATILARYGEKMNPRPFVPPTVAVTALRALTDRRDQVVEDRVREQCRLEACADKGICTRIRRHISALQKEELRLNADIQVAIEADVLLQGKSAALQEVTGVGQQTAAVLLAHLPELGQANRQHISALAGLAPFNNSSGNWEGKRRIQGGRKRLREALYMAALSASRYNKEIKAVHQRLLKKGKVKKVSLVACARKLLIHLNSRIALLEEGAPPQAA